MPGHAFDLHHPPERELIEDCVHCGFCLPTCPTYLLWGEEMDSPRGRIVLMEGGLAQGAEMSGTMVTHFDRCLGCMACVTACPSGVRYDRLIEATRPQVERNYRRPWRERLFRGLLLATLTHPGRLRVLAPALAASRLVRARRAGRATSLLRRWPRLSALASLAPGIPMGAIAARLPEKVPARGARRARVGLLQGCVQRVFFHSVNAAAARVLAAEGFEVYAPPSPRCCGALHVHAGYEPEAVELAKRTVSAFHDCDFVVTTAAGCGSAMKGYGHLLRDEPTWGEAARSLAERTRDVCELLAAFEPVAPRGALPIKVAYHDACHLAHAQGVRDEPRKLLRGIPRLELLEPTEWEICCGSAGLYNVLQPEAARDLGRRKAENLLATGADAIAAGNPGCALQIALHLEGARRRIPIFHPIELLAASLAATSQL